MQGQSVWFPFSNQNYVSLFGSCEYYHHQSKKNFVCHFNTALIKSNSEITFPLGSQLAQMHRLSEYHILCSYLDNLQSKIKIKKIYHCKTIPILHTICTMASLLLRSHCPRRIRLAGHSARMYVFISQISSYLLIRCLGKWNFFSDANRITVSDRKKSLNYTQSIHASFGKVKKNLENW